MYRPSYIKLYQSGELQRRCGVMLNALEKCQLCPRHCNINRLQQNNGFCRSGRNASISSHCDHHGEEPVLSGTHGSGTIFFSNCNLKCVYCQNYQISQGTDIGAREIGGQELADIMLNLQDKSGCHNINLVSPSHFVPQIIEALVLAIPSGLHIPLIYNTNAYDSLHTLRMLDGVIDIYLPDIKYASNTWARRFSQGKGYVEISREAILEMFRQAGNLQVDDDGLAQKGLIVRHLILPNSIAGSSDSLKWLAENVSRETAVSLMAQYYPSHLAPLEPMLCRRITSDEYDQVVELIRNLGFEKGWLQEMDSAGYYQPDFQRDGHPFE